MVLSRATQATTLLTGLVLGAALVQPAPQPKATADANAFDLGAALALFAAADKLADDAAPPQLNLSDPSTTYLAQANDQSTPTRAKTPSRPRRPQKGDQTSTTPRTPHRHVVGLSISPEMIDLYLEVAREVDNQAGDQLAELRRSDPQKLEAYLRQAKQLHVLVQLKQSDPALYRIRLGEVSQMMQVHRAAAELREVMKTGSDGEIEAAKAKLRTLVQVQMALSMKAKCETLARLDEQREQLRQEIDHEARHFNELVEARIRSLLEPQEPEESILVPAAGPASTRP